MSFISKEEVFEFIKEKTLNKFENSKQVKVSANEIIKELELNEQTVYANLRKLTNVCFETYQTRLFRNGKRYKFKQKLYWIE